MIAALLLAVAQPPLEQPPAGQALPAPIPTVPQGSVGPRAIEWDALPPLPYRIPPRMTAEMTAYVRGEMAGGRCPLPPTLATGRMLLRADVAVLIGPGGGVRVTIPRAIGCVTVEQYAAGLAVAFARRNLSARMVQEGSWYRASMVFDWPA